MTKTVVVMTKFNHDYNSTDIVFPLRSQLLQPNLHIMPECLDLVMPECLALAVVKHSLWNNGRNFRVKFLGGTESIHKEVERFAKEWENYANIKFCFVSDGDADIRISFYQHVGSHSQVGNAALKIVPGEPTMNLAITDKADPRDLKRLVGTHL